MSQGFTCECGHLRQFDFSSLLVHELGWDSPATEGPLDLDDIYKRYELARLDNIPVFEVQADNGKIPDAHTRDALYARLAALYERKVLVFVNKEHTQSIWHWTRQKSYQQQYKREYLYFKGQAKSIILSQLARMMSDLGITKQKTIFSKETELTSQITFRDDFVKEEIMEYFCKQTIGRRIIEKLNAQNQGFHSIEEVLMGLDVSICRKLLFDILPNISVLDPACGTGVFLVSALHMLWSIYGAVIGKVEQLDESDLHSWLRNLLANELSIDYAVKKKIITENVFGVDVAAEAVEMARRRLLEDLCSSLPEAETQAISFHVHCNIYVGNVLVAFPSVPEFDQVRNERGGFAVVMAKLPWEIARSLSEQKRLTEEFIKLCYQWLCSGGQCAFILPGNITTNMRARYLRQMLFAETNITGLFEFENQEHIFAGLPHDFRLVLLTFEKGLPTEAFPALFGRYATEELICFPENAAVHIPVKLIERLSPEMLAIARFSSQHDVEISQKMLQFPHLGQQIDSTWNAGFAYELHMAHHHHLFQEVPRSGLLPLYEGKMINQYTCASAFPRYWISERAGRADMAERKGSAEQKSGYRHYRLGYKAISSRTNARTLIATILPPQVFVGNTIIVTQGGLDAQTLLYLVALFNSFVVDFYLRLVLSGLHITIAQISHLPIPRLMKGDSVFDLIIKRAARLICITPEFKDLWEMCMPGSWSSSVTATTFGDRSQMRAQLEGLVAHLYGLTEEEFRYLLTTFRLVSKPVTLAASNAYRDIERGLIK